MGRRSPQLCFDDCPNWEVADTRATEALRLVGHFDQHVERLLISTDEEAQAAHFRGAPTILINGEDPIEGNDTSPFGLMFRVYTTNTGLAGSPTVDELVAALAARA